MKDQMLRLSGLWREKSPDGRSYLSGSLNKGVRLMVFPNDRKQNETDPDYYLCLAPAKPNGKGGGGHTPPPDL